MNFIKRFFRAKGGIRWRLLYALNYFKEFEGKQYLVTRDFKAGEWATINRNSIIKYEGHSNNNQ